MALALVALIRQAALNRRSRERKVDLCASNSGAVSRAIDIGNENRREVAQGVPRGKRHVARVFTLRRTALDGDLSAIHVHLAVTNLVEPGPGKKRLSGRRIFGDLEVVLLRDWTAAEHGVNDAEGLSLVVGQGELAGSSAMGSAALQFHLILSAG